MRHSALRLRQPLAALFICLALGLPILLSGCPEKKQAANVGAGNYCTLVDRMVWTSNADSPAPTSGPPVSTFNIFIMDSAGGHRARLTSDSWPLMNQHPVFTPDCRQIVWARGSASDSKLWIMNLDGSAQKPLSSPPVGEVDGHPWVAADTRVYFVRHRHPSGLHKIWRMNLDGSGATELLGGEDRDHIHPNLQKSGELILYTSTPTGSTEPTEIRVFNQATSDDKVLYAPGWPVSGAIWHPSGDKVVVAEKHDTHYRLSEIAYPSGALIRTLVSDARENTIPYYAYPSGTAIDWVQWAGAGNT